MTEDRTTFRYSVGIIVILGGLTGFGALVAFPIPIGNRDAVVLALGLILGWGSTIVGYEFGSSAAGRKAADAGVKSQDEPQPVIVANKSGNPVPVEEKG